MDMVKSEVPAYERLQDAVAEATAGTAARVLDLGTGTGVTALRVLEHHPGAELTGIDESAGMLEHARRALPAAELRVARLEDELPAGPFDLVVSALAVHHLDGPCQGRSVQASGSCAPTGRGPGDRRWRACLPTRWGLAP